MHKGENMIKGQLSLKVGSAPAKRIHDDMEKNLHVNTSEIFILVCAIVIASIGLNVGSTAVVIGAMLISPIMGPIQTMGYALSIGSKELLKKAIALFILQVLVATIASTLYFWISPLNQPTTEILARTTPTFWDVLIAVFGGFAGIIGVTRAEKTNVIPGVAIATALMPPLATVGFGLAHGTPEIIFGAFYLFTINAFFITLASTVGISLIGIRKSEIRRLAIEKKSRRRIQVVLLLITVPSIISSLTLIDHQVVSTNVDSLIANELESDSRKVISTEIDYDNDVITMILVGTHLSEKKLDVVEESLDEYNLEGYTVKVIQNSLKDTIAETIHSGSEV